jgi:hypothetical protein
LGALIFVEVLYPSERYLRMALILFLSVCSYWRAVNVEMMNATLEFLDEVERRKRVNSGVPPG